MREARGSFTSIFMTLVHYVGVFFFLLLLDEDGAERERDSVLAEPQMQEKQDGAVQ